MAARFEAEMAKQVEAQVAKQVEAEKQAAEAKLQAQVAETARLQEQLQELQRANGKRGAPTSAGGAASSSSASDGESAAKRHRSRRSIEVEDRVEEPRRLRSSRCRRAPRAFSSLPPA